MAEGLVRKRLNLLTMAEQFGWGVALTFQKMFPEKTEWSMEEMKEALEIEELMKRSKRKETNVAVKRIIQEERGGKFVPSGSFWRVLSDVEGQATGPRNVVCLGEKLLCHLQEVTESDA